MAYGASSARWGVTRLSSCWEVRYSKIFAAGKIALVEPLSWYSTGGIRRSRLAFNVVFPHSRSFASRSKPQPQPKPKPFDSPRASPRSRFKQRSEETSTATTPSAALKQQLASDVLALPFVSKWISHIESFSSTYHDIEKRALRVAFLVNVSDLFHQDNKSSKRKLPLNGWRQAMSPEEAFDRAVSDGTGSSDKGGVSKEQKAKDPRGQIAEMQLGLDHQGRSVDNTVKLHNAAKDLFDRQVLAQEERDLPYTERAAITAVCLGAAWKTLSRTERWKWRISLRWQEARYAIFKRMIG